MRTENNNYTTDHFPDTKITTQSGSVYFIDHINNTVSKSLPNDKNTPGKASPCMYIGDIKANESFYFNTIDGSINRTSPIISIDFEPIKLVATTKSGSKYFFDLTNKTVKGPATNFEEVAFSNKNPLNIEIGNRVEVFAEGNKTSIGFRTSSITSIQTVKEIELAIEKENNKYQAVKNLNEYYIEK